MTNSKNPHHNLVKKYECRKYFSRNYRNMYSDILKQVMVWVFPALVKSVPQCPVRSSREYVVYNHNEMRNIQLQEECKLNNRL